MLRLLISLLVAGLIAGGVYYFLVYDEQQPAELQNTTGPIGNPSDAIDAANDAVDQSQNMQNQVDQRAEQAEGY